MTRKDIIILCEVLINILSKYKHEINYEQGVVIRKTIEVLKKKFEQKESEHGTTRQCI